MQGEKGGGMYALGGLTYGVRQHALVFLVDVLQSKNGHKLANQIILRQHR